MMEMYVPHSAAVQRVSVTPVHHHQPEQPCGASFGFDGKLIQYFNVKQESPIGENIPVSDQRLVTVSQVVTLTDFVARSERLDYALESGNMADFCQEKAEEIKESSESKVWQFLQASFSKNPTQAYLSMLGFDSNEIFTKLDGVVGRRQSESVDAMADGFVTFGRGVPDGYGTNQSNGSDESEFDGPSQHSARQSHESEKHESDLFDIPTDDSTEGLVNQALLSGNTEFAVDLCLKDCRWAEALILASTGGPELIKKTQVKYFKKCGNETSNMILAVVTRDLRRLVEHCELHCWKEALATALTYSDSLGFSYLAETLGRRLESSGDETLKKCARLCYICCGHMNHLVENWALDSEKSDSPDHLQDVVEHLMVLRKAGETHGKEFLQLNQILAERLEKYGTILVSQGSLKTALKYISDSTDPNTMDLKERVDIVLGTTPRPVVQTHAPRSRQTSESSTSRHHPLNKRPSYPTPGAVQQHSPAPSNPYDTRRMSGYIDGPNISSLTGPPVPPQPQDMGNTGQGFYNPLNVNTNAAYAVPTYAQQHTPLPPGVPAYYSQSPDQRGIDGRRYSETLPTQPILPSATGWNDPPLLRAKPKTVVTTQKLDAITHPIFGSAAPETQNNIYAPYGGGDAYGSNSLLGYAPMGPPPPMAKPMNAPTQIYNTAYAHGQGPVPTYGKPPPSFNTLQSGHLQGTPSASHQMTNFPPSPNPTASYGHAQGSMTTYGMPTPSNFNSPPNGQSYGMPPPPRPLSNTAFSPPPVAAYGHGQGPPPVYGMSPSTFNPSQSGQSYGVPPPPMATTNIPPQSQTYGYGQVHSSVPTYGMPSPANAHQSGHSHGMMPPPPLPTTGRNFPPSVTPVTAIPASFAPPMTSVPTSFAPPMTSAPTSFAPPITTSFTPPITTTPTPFIPLSSSLATSFPPPLASAEASFAPPMASASFAPPMASASFAPPMTSVGTSFAPLSSSLATSFAPPMASAGASFAPPSSSLATSFAPPMASVGASFATPMTSAGTSFASPMASVGAYFAPPMTSAGTSFAPPIASAATSFAPQMTSTGASFAPPIASAGTSFAPQMTSAGLSFAPPMTSTGTSFATPMASARTSFDPVTSNQFEQGPITSGPPSAPPITSFGPPFAPPSDVSMNHNSPLQNSTSFQPSKPEAKVDPSLPIHTQSLPPVPEPTPPPPNGPLMKAPLPIYAQSLPPLPEPRSTSATPIPTPHEGKGQIPTEHQDLPKVLEELRSACHAVAAQPQMKRKLEDVARKLDIFSEKLREGSLSPKTLTFLHNMVNALTNKDYHLALSIHTQLVTSGNFSEISSFLPAIKVLIQSAAQLGVYL